MREIQYEFSIGKITGELASGLNKLGVEGWQFCTVLQQDGADKGLIVLLQRQKSKILLLAESRPRVLSGSA